MSKMFRFSQPLSVTRLAYRPHGSYCRRYSNGCKIPNGGGKIPNHVWIRVQGRRGHHLPQRLTVPWVHRSGRNPSRPQSTPGDSAGSANQTVAGRAWATAASSAAPRQPGPFQPPSPPPPGSAAAAPCYRAHAAPYRQAIAATLSGRAAWSTRGHAAKSGRGGPGPRTQATVCPTGLAGGSPPAGVAGLVPPPQQHGRHDDGQHGPQHPDSPSQLAAPRPAPGPHLRHGNLGRHG